MNSISNHNYAYYSKNYNMNNKSLNCSSYKTIPSITFKASSTYVVKNVVTKSTVTKFPKKVLTFFAGILGIGTASKISETKNLENMQAKTLEKESNTLENIPVEKVDKLTEYKTKYPEIAKCLDSYDMVSTQNNDPNIGEFMMNPHYSDIAKLAIFETFEQDSQKAYNLAQKLKYDKSKELSPAVLDAIINDYPELSIYPSDISLEDSYNKREIVKQNPLVQDLATLGFINTPGRVVNAFDLAKYSEYCTDEKSANVLLNIVKRDLCYHKKGANSSADENIIKARLYQKHPNMPNEIDEWFFQTKFTPEIEALVDKYLSSERLYDFLDYVKKYGFDGADELLKYHIVRPNALRLAKKTKQEGSLEEIKTLTEKIIMTEEVFDMMEENIHFVGYGPIEKDCFEMCLNGPKAKKPGIPLNSKLLSSSYKPGDKLELTTIPTLNNFIENMDMDKKNLFLRMINDGIWCCSLQNMIDLLPVYSKYPNTKITYQMIHEFNDPLAKAMVLQ